LSIQVWVRGAPVIVDPGTSTYEPGETRRRERSTAAHSTVSIDGGDQFEQWGAFRSGRLPEVTLIAAVDGRIEAEVRWPTMATHRRILSWSTREIVIADTVTGAGGVSESRMTLAPNDTGLAKITSDGDMEIEPAWTAERFDERIRTTSLVQRQPGADAGFDWRLALVDN
jgi:uncharacterized heparinase superfamily protein